MAPDGSPFVTAAVGIVEQFPYASSVLGEFFACSFYAMLLARLRLPQPARAIFDRRAADLTR